MQKDAIFVPAGAGETMHVLGGTHISKLTPEQSGGACYAMEIIVPPGFGPPMHSHEVDSEFFYVTEGEVTLYTPDGERVARKGDFCFLPAGGSHGFRNNGTSDVRALVVITPGIAAHDFFRAVDAETKGAVDVPVVMDLMSKHAIQMVEMA
jgi:quercetin dioxygenase-like cupin family protein